MSQRFNSQNTMTSRYFTIWLFVPLLSLQSVDSKTYRAAVVDYNFQWNSNQSQEENNRVNTQAFVDFIQKAAKQQAQIVVFPENGLIKNFVEVPDPSLKMIVADDSSYPEALRNISAAARQNRIYVVLNLPERYTANRTTRYFNTDIAFDSRGALVARYRKYNQFAGSLDTTKQPEHSMFTTDFGVTFGLFTCFDILFNEPAETMYKTYGVRDFILPSHWFSEMPFLLSIQEQFAWSYGHDANLLASGFKNVTGGSTGSGIYRGRRADPLYTMNSVESSSLLVGDVPIRADNVSSDVTTITNDYMEAGSGPITPCLLKREPKFESYQTGPVFTPSFNTSAVVCQGDLCCTFNVTFSRRTSQYATNINVGPFKYHVPVVLNGIRLFPPAVQVGGVQICGVIGCLTKDLASCSLGKNNSTVYAGVVSTFDQSPIHFESLPDNDDNFMITEIKISGNFTFKDAVITPNAFLSSSNSTKIGDLPKLSDLDFKVIQKKTGDLSFVEFGLRSDVEVMNCGIYSRVFSRDTTSSKSSASFIDVSSKIFSLLLFVTFLKEFNRF